MYQWFASAGQLHIFEKPGNLEEDLHFDGGASILHMGITLFGCREVRFFLGNKENEAGDLVETLDLMPGSVYLGVVAGALHQVVHRPPRFPTDALEGHSLTCMIRTTLFPAPRGRIRRRLPLPPKMFDRLATNIVTSLREEPFRLPSLEECSAEETSAE